MTPGRGKPLETFPEKRRRKATSLGDSVAQVAFRAFSGLTVKVVLTPNKSDRMEGIKRHVGGAGIPPFRVALRGRVDEDKKS